MQKLSQIMSNIRILYTSIEGNTRSFLRRLSEHAESENNSIEIIEISDNTIFKDETTPFVALVPTYLEGGTGIDENVREIFTNCLNEYISYHDNRQFLKGVIGSGNRNFNVQYILTAKRYAEKFNVPIIGDFELMGTNYDIETIYQKLIKIFA